VGELASGEEGLTVSTEPQGRVDEDCTVAVERRLQEGDDPVEEHRGVGRARHDGAYRPACATWARRRNPMATATEVVAEKAISITTSRAW
jgi:hypothetical protein